MSTARSGAITDTNANDLSDDFLDADTTIRQDTYERPESRASTIASLGIGQLDLDLSDEDAVCTWQYVKADLIYTLDY